MSAVVPFEKKKTVAPAAMPGPLDVLREIYRRDFYRFVTDFWPVVEPAEPLVDTMLMQTLCQHGFKFIEALVADLRGETWAVGYFQDLLAEMPPGSSKSLLFTVFLPAFAWGPYGCPWLRFIFSTYDHQLTLRDSRRRRDLMKSPQYQALWSHLVKFKKDTDQQGFYENDRRGWCLSTSVGGSGTGHRGHCFVGDDLMNAIQANSDTAYAAVEEHLRAMSSRGVRQEKYRRLVVGQRLSENDPGGWARAKGFEVLSLATEFDPDTPAQTRIFKDWRTQRGELLNPLRMSAVAVAKARLELGPYGFSAQHNQRPVPVDGGVIKTSWIVERPALPRSGYGAIFGFWDTAFTQKVHNDQSGRVMVGIRNDGQGVDLLHAVGHHLEMHALEKEVVSDSLEWRPVIVAIENKASGISLIQNLRAAPNFPFYVHEINIPVGFGKNERAHAATPFVARRLVGVDWSQPWAQEFRGQLETFPAGKKRDIADAFVHAVLYIQENYRFETPETFKFEAVPLQQHLNDTPPKAAKEAKTASAMPEPQVAAEPDYSMGSDSGTW